jgi:hypothetical protein
VTEPWPVPPGELPQFTIQASMQHPVQRWHDDWRGRDRIMRYIAPCIVCGRLTWAFDDGENDPRGVLGDAACWPIDTTYQGIDYQIIACSICANEYDKAFRAQRLAVERIDHGMPWLDQIRRVFTTAVPPDQPDQA